MALARTYLTMSSVSMLSTSRRRRRVNNLQQWYSANTRTWSTLQDWKIKRSILTNGGCLNASSNSNVTTNSSSLSTWPPIVSHREPYASSKIRSTPCSPGSTADMVVSPSPGSDWYGNVLPRSSELDNFDSWKPQTQTPPLFGNARPRINAIKDRNRDQGSTRSFAGIIRRRISKITHVLLASTTVPRNTRCTQITRNYTISRRDIDRMDWSVQRSSRADQTLTHRKSWYLNRVRWHRIITTTRTEL